MRTMLKIGLPVDKTNETVRNGTLGSTIQSILEELKPEAAYFTAEGGTRGGIIVLDVNDPSELPAIVEPWFLAFNASVEIIPCMTPEDLGKAGGAIEAAAKKYG